MSIVRFLTGVALLPACWGVTRALLDTVVLAAGSEGALSVEAISLAAGMVMFAMAWIALPHPVRAYVLGHELTHALWGLFFGARPSDIKVGKKGGSVLLTRTNMLITLAPYFFPFYTFIVIIAALVTYAFLRPLPFLPLWMLAIGFTWAFHVLFTVQTLTERQPDITLYGRIFSWTFIYIANVAIVLAWLAATSHVTFPQLYEIVSHRLVASYLGVYAAALALLRYCRDTFFNKQ